MSLDHLALLATDVDAFVAAIAAGPADAEIAGCPGWTLVELGTHLGYIHRWAREAIVTGAVPHIDESLDRAPTDLAALAGWVRVGADRLLQTLHDLDPDQPTWHRSPSSRRSPGCGAVARPRRRPSTGGMPSGRSGRTPSSSEPSPPTASTSTGR